MIFKLSTLHRIFFTYFCPTFYGGGPPSSPSTTTQNVNNIPSQLMPYVKTMMGAAENQVYTKDANGNVTGFQPYKPYSNNAGDYVASFSPLQQQAQQGASNLQMPGQFAPATGLAAISGIQGMNAQQNYQNQATDPNAVGAYMNPYIQDALNPALQLQNQSFGIKGAEQQGQATKSGAFGGSREALMSGLNSQSNAMANQQMIGNAYQNAYQNAQQAQQFGANLGLQGAQQANSAAQTLGQLGTSQLGAQTNILGTQSAFGGQQQQQQQQAIDQAVLNWQNAQQQPYMQLGTMSNLIRGIPTGNSTQTQYMAQPSMMSQIGGLAATGIGAYGALKAEGGPIEDKGYARGGIVGYNGENSSVVSSVEAQLNDMDDAHLQDAIQNSTSQSIKELATRILNERKASNMANGGIVGYADDKDKEYGSLVKNYINSEVKKEADNNKKYESIKKARGAIPEIISRSKDFYDSAVNDVKGLAVPLKDTIGNWAFGEDYNKPQPEPTTPAPVNTQQPAPTENPNAITAAAPVNTTPAANITQEQAAKLGPMSTNQPLNQLAKNQEEVQQAAKQGINITQGTPAATQNLENILSPLREDVKTAQTEADKSIAERIEEQNKLEEKYAGKDVGTEEYRKSLKEEKDNAPDEARKMMYMRLAEFGANWASTPGPALVAGMQALKQTLPSVITDKKEHKAAMHNLDKAIYEVNHAEYLERKGKVKEAAQQRTNASNILMKSKETLVSAGVKLLEIQSKERQSDKDNASAERRAEITASAYGGRYGESKLSAKQSVAYDKAVDNAEKDMEASPMTMSLPIEERMKKKNELIKHYIKNDPILKGFKFEDSGDNTGGGEQLKTKSGTPYTIISK